MRKADLIGGVALLAASVIMIFFAVPLGTAQGTYYGLSPTVYPTVMSAGMGLCAIGLIIQSIVQRDGESEPFPITFWQFRMFLLAVAMIIAAVTIIANFGVWYGAPLLIASMMVFLGERNLLLIAVTSLAPVGFLDLMATYVLKAPLP